MTLQPEIAGAGEFTVRRLLQWGTGFLSQAGAESARLDAELLLSHILGWSREKLWLNDGLCIDVAQRQMFEQTLRRRARREPVAYITGVREFWSLDFLVSPAVLVPRPETELLVETALKYLEQFRNSNFEIRILEIGTGSGAIAVSLAKQSDNVEIWATDLCPGALKVAETNAARHGAREKIHFLQGDLFAPVNELAASFHMIVSNPPYVRRGEMNNLPPDVRDWEPRTALDGGWDGLDFYRQVIANGHAFLKDQGLIALEIGADLGDEVSRLFKDVSCYSQVDLHPDYAGRNRVVVARKQL